MSLANEAVSETRLEEEFELPDSEFTSVRISEFYSPRKVAFDLFLRLGENRFLRIFREEEAFVEAELKNYETERGVRQVYFSRAKRASYINSSATLLEKVAPLTAVPLRTKFGVARLMSELYMQEVYEANDDTRPALVDKGRLLCATLAAWIDTQPGLEKYFLRLDQIDSTPASYGFLTGLFSCLLSHRMPWKSRRTSETLLLACFLADIGLFTLPKELQNLKVKRMKPAQKREMEKHPEISAEILGRTKSSAINAGLILIVRQHHEYCDGSGYPNALTAPQTQLLSKVVVLCGDLVRAASDFLLPPGDAAKMMFPEFTEKLMKEHPELVAKYDKDLLIPLFKIFTEGGV